MSVLSPRERVLYAGTCQGTPPLERFPAAKAAGFSTVTLFTSDLVIARQAGLSNADLRAALESPDSRAMTRSEVNSVTVEKPAALAAEKRSSGGVPWQVPA